jgi:uncharacterized protein
VGRTPVRKIFVAALSLAFISGFIPDFIPGARADGSVNEGPRFSTRHIQLGSHLIKVEIADTDDRREHGLMFRKKLDANSGMLFIFENEDRRSFWMKNTLIPLSIGYFNQEKKLLEVIDMQPAILGATRPKTYPSHHKSMYGLEMNLGWFERNKIKAGEKFKFTDK